MDVSPQFNPIVSAISTFPTQGEVLKEAVSSGDLSKAWPTHLLVSSVRLPDLQVKNGQI